MCLFLLKSQKTKNYFYQKSLKWQKPENFRPYFRRRHKKEILGSKILFHLPKLLFQIRRKHFRWKKIHFCSKKLPRRNRF